MARHRRIRLVGQPELGEAGGPGGSARARAGLHPGEEPVQQQRPRLLARHLRRDGAPEQPAAAPHHRHRQPLRAAVGEEPLLRDPAGLHQRAEAGRLEPLAQAPLHRSRQRQVDVVAAEEQVIADRQPREDRPALAQLRLHQREVGGPAAHVDHQHADAARAIGEAERLLEPPAVARRPLVEGRLRLLEQGHAPEPRRPRGGQGQLAGHLVEGRRHRQHDLLLRQRRVGVGGVPGVAQVAEVERRGVHRREPRHALGRAPGQDRRGPVGARVREPALGRGDQPPGDERPLRPRQLPHRDGPLAPGQPERLGRQLRAGQVGAGREEPALGHLPRRDQLRDWQRPDGVHQVPPAGEVHRGERGVDRPEVDADEETRSGHPLSPDRRDLPFVVSVAPAKRARSRTTSGDSALRLRPP